MNFDDPLFKSEFWRWFDNISPAERKKFKEYPADMAEIFFYNKYFSKGIDPFEGQVAKLNIASVYETEG
jgi:hypothetical protein